MAPNLTSVRHLQYQARGPVIDRTSYNTTLAIDIITNTDLTTTTNA